MADELNVGDIAPDFTAASTDRESFHLADEIRNGPVLLNFYVGDFGINCTNYMGKFIEAAGEFEKLGVRLVAVNPDSLESHKLWKARMGSPFEYVCDAGQAASKQYGAIVKAPSMVTGFTNREFFLVGTDGRIRYIWRAPVPKVLPELQEILKGVSDGLALKY